VRDISFGLPPYSGIEEDEVSKPKMPGPDHPLLSWPHSLITQAPPNQKSTQYVKSKGGAVVLQAPEDLVIGKLHLITLNGRADLGEIEAGRGSSRIEGGALEAGQMRCGDFKAVRSYTQGV
jgi:hypothetical protein